MCGAFSISNQEVNQNLIGSLIGQYKLYLQLKLRFKLRLYFQIFIQCIDKRFDGRSVVDKKAEVEFRYRQFADNLRPSGAIQGGKCIVVGALSAAFMELRSDS